MSGFFEQTYELRYSEMTNRGEISPVSILLLLEEAAADHCHSIGYSLYDLKQNNKGWVLLSGLTQMYRYPNYKEKITIRTWMSSHSDIRGFRENIIYDEAGIIIGKSKSQWVFFDTLTRRPSRIYPEIQCQWINSEGICMEHDLCQKIEPIHSSLNCKEFDVHKFDIDNYNHVNNLRYFQWLIESLPESLIDNYDLFSIDGRFISEAKLGDTLIALVDKDVEPDTFKHTIKVRDTGKVCATAKTIWRKKK